MINNLFICFKKKRMLAQIISDIHLELRVDFPRIPKILDVNILILAGDIGRIDCVLYRPFFEYISNLGWKKIIYVPGNHEFYHKTKSYNELQFEYRQFFNDFPNISFLDNEAIFVGTTLFYGSVMWTCTSKDFTESRVCNFDVSRESFIQLNGKMEVLERTPGIKKIIITHYPILRVPGISHPKYDNQPESTKKYFSTNYFNLISSEYIPDILCVISGHTHYSYILESRGVKILSNQYGYPTEEDISAFCRVFDL
jgi:predicted phosphodiesterase